VHEQTHEIIRMCLFMHILMLKSIYPLSLPIHMILCIGSRCPGWTGKNEARNQVEVKKGS
jgi:hypothetical protein